MSAVGFRCISETRKSPTEPLRFKVRYFANSSLGNIEGDDEIGLKDVLGVLAYDALRDAVKQMFEESEP
ncbi:hypothetical protein GFL49_36860 [Rhizobium leguminosarum bv. viciae]|nr:hypothetical protein [Rhizobium leguminosarum bv. viciae]